MVNELTTLFDAHRWLFIALLPIIYMVLACVWMALIVGNNRSSTFTIKGFGLSIDVDVGRRQRRGDRDGDRSS